MKTLKVLALVVVALGLAVGTTFATYHEWSSSDDDENYLAGNDDIWMGDGDDGIWMGNGIDKLHFLDGNDQLNMGYGNDTLGLAYGTDLIDLSGGFGIITFGLYGNGTYPWPDTTLATNYISCDTSDDALNPFPTSMEIRSDEVTVKANAGDVIIQLGN